MPPPLFLGHEDEQEWAPGEIDTELLRRQDCVTDCRAVADKISTSQSVISELEDANYEGNSLEMLTGVFLALGHRMNITIVGPRAERRKQLQPV